MREIKFRVWNKIRKVMSYDVTLYANRWVECVYVDGTEDKYPPSVADHFLEVMQFTGLKDKNGKEIYEGDIVETVTARGNPFGTIDVVRYQDGGFKLVDDTESLLPIYIGDKEVISIEIIGNIYENPELLE